MDSNQPAHIAGQPVEIRCIVGMLDYLKKITSEQIAPDTITLHPIRHSPEGTDSSFGIYSVLHNRNYEQPYIREDIIKLKLYHPIYNSILSMTGALIDALNQDAPSEYVDVYDDLILRGVRILDIACVHTGSVQSQFVDGEDRYNADFSIGIRYVDH